jgi:hypothetical protein
MKTIALISCVSKKQEGQYLAKNLYISDLFKKSYRYCEKFDSRYILSAKYGLVEENEVISNYDLTLNSMSREDNKNWAINVYLKIIALFGNEEIEFNIHAGNNYIKNLLPLIKKHNNFTIVNELEGLSIGKRLSFYLKKGRKI